MILLKLSIGKDLEEQRFDIESGELLSSAVTRALKDVPLGKFEAHETFNVAVNGLLIDKDFWSLTQLKEKDAVVISPKIKSGDAGQIFKQALIITIAVAASVYLGPGGGFWGGMAVAATTVAAALILNGLIPPPSPNLGNFGGLGGVDSSQMYAISGQSNAMSRLGTVPKVYGIHRMFPMLAATPYTELSVDPSTGETIQFLYGIYDFGLGVMDISEIKIGDTPLTTESFTDFEYRLVDPNKPSIDEDVYDERLESEFKNYKSSRVVTPLSFALSDGDEFIQNSDDNTDVDPQEIVLDFVAPRGLFSYSSNGATGKRSVRMDIHFALVGTSDWKAYNDLNFVDSYESIGGNDLSLNFNLSLAPVLPDVANDYYSTGWDSNGGSYYTPVNAVRTKVIKPGTKKLLVVDDSRLNVGSKVFLGTRFLGVIETINPLVGPNTELILDRVISASLNLPAYNVSGKYVLSLGGKDYTYDDVASNIQSIKAYTHESASAIFTGDKQSPIYGNFRFTPKIAGQYQVRVKRVSTSGDYTTQTADDVTWGAITTSYKKLPITTTKRHLFLELKIKATDQLNGNIQNLSAVVSSIIPVYDPLTQTWTRQATNNPAWVFCDLLTGEVNKKAVPYSRLHMDSIVEWSEYCDEIPASPPSATYVEPRFQSNFVLDFSTTLQGILAQVSSAAQASLNIIDGKYGVLIDSLKTTPVQIFTPRNSKDFSSTRLYGPRPHALKIKFIDPQLNWDISEKIVYDNGYNSVNAIEFEELTSFACTNQEQAWRFGRYLIAQNKLRQETISLLVDFENLVCTRGDYVQITQDVMRVGGSPARVKDVAGNVITIDDSLDIDPGLNYAYVYRTSAGEILTSTTTPLTASTFEVDGTIPAIGELVVIGEAGSVVFDCIVKSISPNDDMSANLVLIEKADEIFEYESTDTLPDYDPQLSTTSRPDFYPPKAVTNLEVTDNFWECSVTKSGYNYFVELIWEVPLGSVYEFFEVWVNDGRGYTLFDKTTAKLFRYDVVQARLDIEHGFKVVAVSASGKKLQLIEMPEVLVTPETKTSAPSDIEALNMSITNQVLQLSWASIADCDCAQYSIRFSPDTNDIWESSIPLVTVSREVNSVSVQARTGVYLIKAIDFAGNQSENASLAITTIPSLFDLNVIETVNDAPDFNGTLNQTVELGDAIILDEAVSGDVDTVQYYEEGFYESVNVLDLDDVFTVRLQSQIRADGYKFGELMSDWEHLEDVEHLNTATTDDWDVGVQYRATDVFAAMADWEHLSEVDHINYGAGIGFTDWRPIPTIGDATGRIFQFRLQLKSLTPNVTPRIFDGSIKADMPDRVDSFENQISTASEAYVITYEHVFKGPSPSPNVQVSIDDAQTGDYWAFDYKTLEGLAIRIYDKLGNQVVRQFDLQAKGFGRRHTTTI